MTLDAGQLYQQHKELLLLSSLSRASCLQDPGMRLWLGPGVVVADVLAGVDVR
jgi:hypothetical protein